MTSSNRPVATAILAVYNSDSTIEACLKTLVLQSQKIEIIIIDDGSTDRTVELINQFIDSNSSHQIKLLKQSHQGPAIARNFGAKHAQSDILLFVDADMTFDQEYVAKLIKPIKTGEVIGTYTIDERVSNWDNVWARCWNLQEGWAAKKRFPANPPRYGTDFRAILKSEFERVGGFDNLGYTDTWSLFNKLGKKPLSTNATCYHRNPSTLSSVYTQARWSAKRPYKHGFLGSIYALLRTTLPISLIVGLAKFGREPSFLVFKIVYDLGRFVGIAEMLITGNLTK
jgi:glycosyltransferase involved in cell wall biosynthesis